MFSTKVLLPHRILGNIYVRELGNAYKELGCEVIYGPENLYESNLMPDVVHVNWPEELYRTYGAGDSGTRSKRLMTRIEAFKSNGCHVALTIHNEKPHELQSGEVDYEIHQYLIDNADIVHHHCECSVERLKSRYSVPAALEHFVAPHGHYLSYANTVSLEEARNSLNLPPEAFVYLHFGAIRKYKGIDLVMRSFQRVRRRNDYLIVAGRMSDTGGIAGRIRLAYLRKFAPYVRFHLNMIDDYDIQTFFNAADAVVLGHIDGLNSGVAVLGMSFGRPVIGPRLGCIPSVLGQGRNFMYATGDGRDLEGQMVRVREVGRADAHQVNHRLASEWGWERIAAPVLNCIGK